MKYSICITHYNNIQTLEESLGSILNQIDQNFEVVVVDNMSNDGSQDVLKKYANDRKITLVQKKCLRGVGRQIAFETSSGDYIISNLDMDDMFYPALSKLLSLYHERCEGNLLLACTTPDAEGWGSNVTIGPRDLISKLGGWRDLQYYEDWDLWSRAAQTGKYMWTNFSLVKSVNNHRERRDSIGRLRYRYARYFAMTRLGKRIFSEDEKISPAQRAVLLLSRIGATLRPLSVESFNRDFNNFDQKYELTLRE